ncbi:gluconate 2-dehydrogenase subunit 3 family protein [Paenibacillus koleovorans]|uniref:gluconate 2-dehydrogenase subunit 3 family protein n=1 Tax=Paenibacillus koleovorans TaxID=121608 RepID=UPI000FD78488|nr:gluconate 2-dehydrogenase subunit 3 family protein [Paenibacillus koleovorans]
MTRQTHYPSYNVMNEREEWDAHTQAIVGSRLRPHESYSFLSQAEAELLRRICSLLVDDESPDVLDFILSHIDQTLHQSPGESQRKVGVPDAPVLVRSGLEALEQEVRSKYDSSFVELDIDFQKQILRQISESAAAPPAIWGGIPQDALFKKLLNMTVESYCSHPKVWSEIGYGGPAYPRGYVRTELGLLDPWEAKPER